MRVVDMGVETVDLIMADAPIKHDGPRRFG